VIDLLKEDPELIRSNFLAGLAEVNTQFGVLWVTEGSFQKADAQHY
jgi:hypothetical protein